MKRCDLLLALSNEDPYPPIGAKSVLEGKGYQVTELSGSQAIEMLNAKDFDLVITDLLAVLEKAKELNPETMVILMLTASSKLIPTAQAIRTAVDGYLFKPFEIIELERRVAACVEKIEHRQ